MVRIRREREGTDPKALALTRGVWARVVIMVALGTASACAAADEPAAANTDLGTQTTAAWGSQTPWTLSAEPALDLLRGTDTDSPEFYDIKNAVLLADGSMAVLEGAMHRVRLLGPDGRTLWSFGREGDGPEEFRNPSFVRRDPTDTLVVWDSRLSRLTVLSPEGDLIRVLTLPVRGVENIVATSQSRLIVQAADREYVSSAVSRRPSRLIRWNASLSVQDTLAVLPGEEGVWEPNSSITALFWHSLHVATHENGLVVAIGDTLGVDILSEGGRVMVTGRVPGYPLDLEPDQSEAERTARMGPDPHPIFRQMYESLPRQDRRPALSSLVVDDLGFAWMESFRGWSEPDHQNRWQVFSPEGRWMGPIILPKGLEVLDIRNGRILGRMLDELDVEHLVVYALERRNR